VSLRGSLVLAGGHVLKAWRSCFAVVKVVRREPLYAELGQRIRNVRQGTDCSRLIYLLTDGGNARIIRIGVQDASKDL
jgi:hypothetical protein